ncbi:Octanoyltransferase LipM [Planctomycetes bacterium Poly30]|uniref:Octanoyltransferase LipM n=1 Tax=Saltatorellus ferox TaxID=2528018 RepID=A0A518EWN5_9BACT|nr:Octanoyltransferase LipM [Planctomycetes bacterium Poly30]
MKPREWRLLETYDVSPALAMGLDEALLLGSDTSVGPGSAQEAGPEPTLRLYTWQPDAISLGYFQAFDDVPAAHDHAAVVRRLTGGGAIHHHAGELTFSITLDAGDPAYVGSVPDSYERTHEAVMAALRSLGVPGVVMRRDAPCLSDRDGTGMCFHESTPQDICWPMDREPGLRKGVGTAQRRIRERGRGRILHHGSVKLGGSPLEPGVATAAEAIRSAVDIEAAAAALKDAVCAEFGVRLRPDSPTEVECRRAADLGQRYGSPEFLHRSVRRHWTPSKRSK